MEQIELQMAKSTYTKQMLIGDFNTPHYEPLYRDISYNWTDFYVESGSGFGLNFPNTTSAPPILRLDYAFGKGPFSITQAKVVEGGTSDHKALIFQVEI